MKTIDEMIDHLLQLEGGYVNDPDDPGGPTKYGITIGTLRSWRGRSVTAADVQALTLNEARRIYKRRFFQRPRISELPANLQPTVFDMYVNAGGNAIKILQRVLRQFGEPVAVDGSLGPQTIGAAKKVYAAAGDYLVNAYGIARRNYYYSLADRRRASRKFARRRDGGKGGWITRAEEFIDQKYHLSEAQHKARVSKWD